MKILWLNLRKRGRNVAVLRAIERLVERDGYDLLMLQETLTPADDTTRPLNLRGGRLIHFSADLSVLSMTPAVTVELLLTTPNAVAVAAAGIAAFNIHFSPYSSLERERDLQHLKESIEGLGGKAVAIGGDFNLAPRACDGVYGGTESTWTSRSERQLFTDLLREMNLIDLLALRSEAQEFSIVRKRNGSEIEFRCDLVLCSEQIAAKAKCKYLHETRVGPWAFTDHSGLSFEIGIPDGA